MINVRVTDRIKGVSIRFVTFFNGKIKSHIRTEENFNEPDTLCLNLSSWLSVSTGSLEGSSDRCEMPDILLGVKSMVLKF